jgi:UDP-N-acetylmuramoyl-tripeptide--D-alanyl-D-alanine ligase
VQFLEDCYNSNPAAVKAGLEAFSHQHIEGRRVVVLGDMLELGEVAVERHRDIGAFAARCDVQMLIAVGEHAQAIVDGWNRHASAGRVAMHFTDPEEAWMPLWSAIGPGDGVFVKGSRGMRLERLAERIESFVKDSREAAA